MYTYKAYEPHEEAKVEIPCMIESSIGVLSNDGGTHCEDLIKYVVQGHLTWNDELVEINVHVIVLQNTEFENCCVSGVLEV